MHTTRYSKTKTFKRVKTPQRASRIKYKKSECSNENPSTRQASLVSHTHFSKMSNETKREKDTKHRDNADNKPIIANKGKK